MHNGQWALDDGKEVLTVQLVPLEMLSARVDLIAVRVVAVEAARGRPYG